MKLRTLNPQCVVIDI